MPSTSPLTRANYASVIGYALYPIIFSALELVGINTLPSNAETSERYQVSQFPQNIYGHACVDVWATAKFTLQLYLQP